MTGLVSVLSQERTQDIQDDEIGGDFEPQGERILPVGHQINGIVATPPGLFSGQTLGRLIFRNEKTHTTPLPKSDAAVNVLPASCDVRAEAHCHERSRCSYYTRSR